MAEALCGPSNALQNFQKHTSVDRTLQQDRNVASRRNEQGFRSTGPKQGALDAEFHAFQAPQLSSGPLQRAQLPLAHITRYATPPQQALPDWASDFQKLSVNGSRTATPGVFQQARQAPVAASGGWHSEFMNQGQSAQQHGLAQQQPMMNQWQPQHHIYDPYMEESMYAPSMQSMQQIRPEQTIHNEPEFDDAAFAQAFDQARADVEQTIGGNGKGKAREAQPEEFSMEFACTDPGDVMGDFDFDAAQLGLASTANQSTTRSDKLSQALEDALREIAAMDDKSRTQGQGDSQLDADLRQTNTVVDHQPRIGADTIQAKPDSEAINPQAEADELSRTAGHLLDTLKDETNTKFQQSSFLALMRQLRDKEVRVDGDKMVPVNEPIKQIPQTQSQSQAQPHSHSPPLHTQTSHPGGRYYPYDAFSRAPLSMPPATDEGGPAIQHWYANP